MRCEVSAEVAAPVLSELKNHLTEYNSRELGP